MTFVRPWALIGLAFLALPILIHMMGRGTAKVVQFPSLRFLDTSRLLPARRTRIHDIVLLVIRCLAIAVAAIALAGPVFGPRAVGNSSPGEINRLVIVDTSASMARTTPSGATAVAAARRFADSVKTANPLSTVIETARPAAALPGAAAWLATQTGAGEIAIISDFQVGAIDSVALAAVPPQVGLRFMRVPLGVLGRPGPPASLVRLPPPDVVAVLAGAGEGANAAAVREAARAVGQLVPAADERARLLVHARGERRGELLRTAAPFTDASDVEFVARVIADSLLSQAAVDAIVVDSAAAPAGAVALARTRSGAVAAFAASVTDGSTGRVAVFSNVVAASATAVALHIAVARAGHPAPQAAEFETENLTDAVLAGWQRAAGAAPVPATEASDANPLDTAARWLWLAALALLVVETWARTSPRFANTIRPATAEGGANG